MGTLRLSCALVYQILGSRARGRKMFLSPVCYRGRRGERLVEAQSFHLPSLWPARFWKRLAECFANALPWVRARGAHCTTALREADGEAMALPFMVGPWVGSGSRGRSPSRKRQCHWPGRRAARSQVSGLRSPPLLFPLLPPITLPRARPAAGGEGTGAECQTRACAARNFASARLNALSPPKNLYSLSVNRTPVLIF